jgi:hypothetical protein
MFKRKYYLFNYTNYEKKLFSAPMRALVNTVKRLMYIINLLEKENNTTMKPLSIFNCRKFFFRYILQLSKYRLKKMQCKFIV